MIEKELQKLEHIKAELEKLGYRNIVIAWNESTFQFGISIHADKPNTNGK